MDWYVFASSSFSLQTLTPQQTQLNSLKQPPSSSWQPIYIILIHIKREREREEVVKENEHDNSKPLVSEGVNHQSLVATGGKRLKSL
jgi:hypothetical protein